VTYLSVMNPDDHRIDRTAFSIVYSHEEAEAEDRAYWFSKTPYERLVAAECIRRTLYGYDPDTVAVRRVFEIVSRPPR
jgi:hypothetical protein